MKILYTEKKLTRVEPSLSYTLKRSSTPPYYPPYGLHHVYDRQVEPAQQLFQGTMAKIRFLAVLLIAGILSLGTARADVESVENAEERLESLVNAINSFDKEQNNVVVIIVSGEIIMKSQMLARSPATIGC